MNRYVSLALLLLFFMSSCTHESKKPSGPFTASRQLLVVTSPGWDDVQGELRLYQREKGAWKAEGDPIPVTLGMKGMAWGRGVEDFRSRKGPHKQEGDQKAPAGVFLLGDAFGYTTIEAASWIKMPYIALTPGTLCVDEAGSPFYNRIVDEKEVNDPALSAERMRREDNQYSLGLWVLHNFPESESGAGSCIFMHVRKPDSSGTLGCTAMDYGQMRHVLLWLDPAAQPLLIQAPEGEIAFFTETAGI
ncbi:MAG: hypothetical protein EAZ89_04955 [Bacteroidetes bacterium]|nr:MAG: hypothetical protein EAZ89_04955 [Bacteroidota bacterium]